MTKMAVNEMCLGGYHGFCPGVDWTCSCECHQPAHNGLKDAGVIWLDYQAERALADDLAEALEYEADCSCNEDHNEPPALFRRSMEVLAKWREARRE